MSKLTLAQRIDRFLHKEEWAQNMASVPQTTCESIWQDKRKSYHSQTYTGLYLKGFEL